MRENGRVYLIAAVVPPQEILDELWSLVETIEPPASTAEPPQVPRKTRLLRRREAPTTEVMQPPPVLEVAPVTHAQVALAKFGNLARNDVDRLVEALGVAAAEWSSPRLRLSGYSTLESEQDPSIWVDLDGDLDALRSLVRGVHDVAKALGLFVDRRIFHPRLRLGSARPSASESELESLVAELAGFESAAWWQTGFGLYTLADLKSAEKSYRSLTEIALGPHVAH